MHFPAKHPAGPRVRSHARASACEESS